MTRLSVSSHDLSSCWSRDDESKKEMFFLPHIVHRPVLLLPLGRGYLRRCPPHCEILSVPGIRGGDGLPPLRQRRLLRHPRKCRCLFGFRTRARLRQGLKKRRCIINDQFVDKYDQFFTNRATNV